ncbi:MAG TPA: 4,5-DOPA dioxygenase extradiol [Anaeromyxobacteraceae bacterium]|nr:4,5-DOPA dioxygenase extradiol [Anaeromyxobacteraceae bacterium]
MPVLFVGHGSPMNAIEENEWSRGFRALAALLPRPRAILAVSAHWYVAGTFATSDERPATIHDFGGFPEPLYRIEYPAPGDPALARRAVSLVGEQRAALRGDWGLDHGTWSVLLHAYPAADVPVVQLSIDGRLPPAEHLAIGRRLAPLRDEGVLLLGSGNVTHNLRLAFTAMRTGERSTPDWARRFDADVARAVADHDHAFLVRAPESDDGRLSHPTPDHYLPLLYVAGASQPGEPVGFPIEGFDLGSLSMRSILIGSGRGGAS